MKKLLYLIAWCAVCSMQAQMASTQPIAKSWRITDAFFYNGAYSGRDFGMSQGQANDLAPGARLMNMDLTGFSRSDYGDAFGGSMFAGSMGLRRTSVSDPSGANGPLWRIGFNYSSSTLLGSTWYRQQSARYDTLTSSATGEQIFVDTVHRQSVSARYEAQRLQLDASVLFFTKTNTRVKLFGGFGATAGVTMQPNTRIFYSNFTSAISIPGSNGDYGYDGFLGNGAYEQESFDNRGSWAGGVYVPMGLDFCLGKRRPFWKMLHLQYELRPGIAMIAVPEISTFTHVFLQQGISLRVNLASDAARDVDDVRM
jgi:hypothetical protein